MEGKIGLEEHFAIDETLDFSKVFLPAEAWGELKDRLTDIHEKRLGLMDRHGIEMMILSLNAPAVQGIPDTQRAIETARRANEFLADQVARRPNRFQALAALPMQDPDAAVEELQRCVKDCGFKGALVNGFSQRSAEDSAVYLDLPQYAAFWDAIERLDVPFYLHPRDPLPSRAQHYEGHPWFLGPVWAFAVETSIHALRLMAAGLFDRHPRLQIILGHLGEGLPYSMWRVDHRLKKWPRGIPARKPLSEYLRSNFYITTSGNFRTQTLIDAMLEVGADRLLFSTDYPFEDVADAAEWFDTTSISETDRLKIGRLNAIKLFKLD
ncbi:MAG: amidohydrolase [Acidobacteria bacterium]|nr:amidohydrolase [Acidobacteriota bacterium]